MVTTLHNPTFSRPRRREAAMLITELLVAITFLCAAVIPLAYSFAKEQQYLHNCYQRAIALEIVDGEMELLTAGEWRGYPDGVHKLVPTAQSAKNLPPGTLQLTVVGKQLSLEWLPDNRDQGGPITRKVTLK